MPVSFVVARTPSTPFIWNENDKAASVTVVSPKVITASSNGLIRSNQFVSTGKWYVEFDISGAGAVSLGVADDVHPLIGYTLGWYAASVAIGNHSTLGRLYHDGTFLTTGFTYTDGDYFMYAWDMGTGDMWIGKNGSWQTGDPALGTSPRYTETEFIGADLYMAAYIGPSVQVTMKTLSSEFSTPAPTGFTPIGDL